MYILVFCTNHNTVDPLFVHESSKVLRAYAKVLKEVGNYPPSEGSFSVWHVEEFFERDLDEEKELFDKFLKEIEEVDEW